MSKTRKSTSLHSSPVNPQNKSTTDDTQEALIEKFLTSYSSTSQKTSKAQQTLSTTMPVHQSDQASQSIPSYELIATPIPHDPPTMLDEAWSEANLSMQSYETDSTHEDISYITPESQSIEPVSSNASDDFLAEFLARENDLEAEMLGDLGEINTPNSSIKIKESNQPQARVDDDLMASDDLTTPSSLYFDFPDESPSSKPPVALFDENLSPQSFQKNLPANLQTISPELPLPSEEDQLFDHTTADHAYTHVNYPEYQSIASTRSSTPSKKKYIVFAGGKGGVGRSLLAANLALYLSRLGRHKVMIADLDPNGSNIHTYLGLDPVIAIPGELLRSPPQAYLQAVNQSDVHLCRIHHPIHQHLTVDIRKKAIDFIQEQDCDYVILDVGTYADSLNLDLFLQAQFGIVVFTPNHTAIERGYTFLQSALYHSLLGGNHDAAVVSRALLTADQVGHLHSPETLIQALKNVNQQAAQHIQTNLANFSPKIIMNQCRTRSERNLCGEICKALWKKWHISPTPLASIDHDELVTQSVLKRKPMVFDCPGASSSLDLEKLARSILSQDLMVHSESLSL